MNTDTSHQETHDQAIPVEAEAKETFFFPNDGEHVFTVAAKSREEAEKANTKYLDDLKKGRK